MSINKERKSMIKVRGRYSDRNGFNPVCNTIQIDDLDDRIRVILFNEIWELVHNEFYYSLYGRYSNEFVKELLGKVFGEIFYSNIAVSREIIFNKIKDAICQAPIHEVWDIIEFICNKLARSIYDKAVNLH